MRKLLLLVLGPCCACGPTSPSIDGGAATCHELVDVGACAPELATLEAQCSEGYGAGNPDPIACEGGVKPDGNCKPLDRSVVCEGVDGEVYCCGEN